MSVIPKSLLGEQELSLAFFTFVNQCGNFSNDAVADRYSDNNGSCKQHIFIDISLADRAGLALSKHAARQERACVKLKQRRPGTIRTRTRDLLIPKPSVYHETKTYFLTYFTLFGHT